MPVNLKTLPSLDEVKELLNYDPVTGLFSWRKSSGSRRAGANAGSFQLGYLKIRINNQIYQAHRLAWLLETGSDPGDLYIDHIDGNKMNNSFSNLRLCTPTQNQYNRAGNSKASSEYKGVSFDKQASKWRAQITIFGKKKFLGRFETPELAYEAYCQVAKSFHGDYAKSHKYNC